MLIDAFLILFRPPGQGVTMFSVGRFAAKFRHDQGLLILHFPGDPIGFFRQAIVPPYIFVTAEYIDVLSERVVYHLRFVIYIVTLHRRRDHPSRVQASGALDQLFEECQSGVTNRSLIGHGPDNHGRSVFVASNHFRQLVLSVFEGRWVFP